MNSRPNPEQVSQVIQVFAQKNCNAVAVMIILIFILDYGDVSAARSVLVGYSDVPVVPVQPESLEIPICLVIVLHYRKHRHCLTQYTALGCLRNDLVARPASSLEPPL